MCNIFAGLFATDLLATEPAEEQPAEKSRFEIEMEKMNRLVDPSMSLEALNMISEHGWNLLLAEVKKTGNEDLFWLAHRLNFLDYYCRNILENAGKVPENLEEYMPETLVDLLNRLAAFKWL